MRSPSSRAAQRAINAYDGAPRGDRFHVRARWLTCPFRAVEHEVPLKGRILEVGCGHGLFSIYLAACSPHREVLGVDIDGTKLDVARQAAARFAASGSGATGSADGRTVDGRTVEGEKTGRTTPLPVRFELVESRSFAGGTFDAICVVDVLYLLPAAARFALLDECVDHLEPGGVLVIKEADRSPRWKGAVTVAQELLATKVLHITEGEGVEFSPPSAFAEHLRARHLEVAVRRVDRGYVHPHVNVVATRPFRVAGE